MAKDETEIGITGKPIPKKKRSPKKQHEFEKKRRENLGQNVGGRTYRSDVSPNFNPRSVREEILVDYLLDEGFASDERSAQAIAGAMSEFWIESISESLIGDFEAKKRSQMGYKGPAPGLKTSPGYQSPTETRNDIKPEMRHLFLQAKNKSSNKSQTA